MIESGLHAAMFLAISLVCGTEGFACVQETQSTLPVRATVPERGKPLASRLQENDKVVLLTMLEEPNIVAGPSGPFPRAIVSLMRTRQVVLLIEHVRLSAFETTDGGWIRTRVDASITERFKSGPLPLSQRNVQFEFDGGQLAVNGVTVKTDRYPSFVEGTPHLVALARDADNDPWKLDHFWAHPGADGNMIAMKQSNGQFVSNTLHGQSMALVLDALRQRRPR